MARYGVPQNALTIALHGGLYLAIIMDFCGVPQISLNCSLAWRPLISDCNGPLWRTQNALNIAPHGGHYLPIIMEGPTLSSL
jgi:hypothetical protein